MTPSEKPAGTTSGERLKLMIVDDGRLVTPALMRALTEGGFKVEPVADPDYALTDTRGQRYDAIIINSDFAEVDALWLCLALRVQGCLSVIVVISRATNVSDELAAFRAGATDRVGHAIPRQLLVQRMLAQIEGARIRVTGLLYPVTAELPTPGGVFTMSLVPALIRVDTRQVSFTRTEERLFARLWAGRGAVVSHSELIASAWLGAKVSLKAVGVHLSRLRRKLQRHGFVVEHFRDRGYRLSLPTPKNTRRSSSSPPSKN